MRAAPTRRPAPEEDTNMFISNQAAETAALGILLPFFSAVAMLTSLVTAFAGMALAAC